jgi:23S rRNA (uracil1939-C5)-methyltransferase/tRNA (uracil-5-)-methyltransferase
MNCKFVAASAEAIFMSHDPIQLETFTTTTYVKDFPKDNTVVVIDPPRKGCSEEFLEQLYSYASQRVVYMSCDPATQARDAEGIVKAGYTIVSIQPFDLFPQTRHIESLIVFEKTSQQ